MPLGRRHRSRASGRQSGLLGGLCPVPGRVIGWLGVSCGLLWLGLWPALLSAEEHGSSSGVVQREGHGVAAHRLMLIRIGPQQEVQRTPGQTDTPGGFLLEATGDLPLGDRVSFEPRTFVHFRGTALAPRFRSWVQLLHRTGTAPLLRIAAYACVICLACLGILVPCYERWQNRRPQDTPRPLPVAQRQDLRASKQRLLQSIVRLDKQREANSIAEGEYQPRRQDDKKRLLTT